MAKYIRPHQLEKKTVTRHFAIKWSMFARVDFYLLERKTRACSSVSLHDCRVETITPKPQRSIGTGARQHRALYLRFEITSTT